MPDSKRRTYKKIVDNDQREHYIDREKVSAIYQSGSFTVFIIDGANVAININIENALNWLTSVDE